MTSKTLSTGTLSLRFMQNAQRAKEHVPVVEAEQARIKDDGEWEVAREVREAWGVDVGANGSSLIQRSVTYESSYLPFIFPSTSDADEGFPSASMKRGRRSFNKKGEEIEANAEPEKPAASAPAPASTSTQPDKPTKSNTPSQRPTSISLGAGAGRSSKALKDPTRTARAVIHDAGEVGTDLRPARGVFLRPAGVDAPAEKTGRVEEGEEGTIKSEREVKKEEVMTGARDKSKGTRVKRGHDGEDGGGAGIIGEGEGKRRKKKKQLVE